MPLVRRDGTKPEVAILLDTHRGALLFEGVNMYSKVGEIIEHRAGESLSLDEIYDRGWRVD